MRHLSVLSSIIVFLVSASCQAGHIYQLIDYPALQNGYTLSGTVEVSHTASEDGILTSDEVLDWSWTAIGTRTLHARFQNDPSVDHVPTQLEGIGIDASAIYLTPGADSRFVLEEYVLGLVPELDATHRMLGASGGGGYQPPTYWLSLLDDGDIASMAWSADLPANLARWQIAQRIPEPGGLLICCTLAVTALSCRCPKV